MLLAKRVNHPFPVISDMFDSFFNDDFFNFPVKTNHWKSTVPSVNVKETDTAYELELAAPGLTKDDIKLEMNDDVLTISSEKKTDNEVKEDNYTRREFAYQSFSRSFTLPDSVEGGKINAKYENGILHIDLPKKAEAKPQPARVIKVK